MYGEDTFFQLDLTARIGVLVISALLGALVLWVCWRMARVLRRVTAVLLALGLFMVFEWLSIQVFYLWYMVVFDGLPFAWVAGYWPRPGAALEVLTFQAKPSLSAHGRAALGWALVLIALLSPRTRGPATGPWVS